LQLVSEVEWKWKSPSAVQVHMEPAGFAGWMEPHLPRVRWAELEVEGLLDKVDAKIKVALG
jgi:hypothetical protein